MVGDEILDLITLTCRSRLSGRCRSRPQRPRLPRRRGTQGCRGRQERPCLAWRLRGRGRAPELESFYTVPIKTSF